VAAELTAAFLLLATCTIGLKRSGRWKMHIRSIWCVFPLEDVLVFSVTSAAVMENGTFSTVSAGGLLWVFLTNEPLDCGKNSVCFYACSYGPI